MKKIILLFVITLIGYHTQAQDNNYAKGRLMLGGNVAFTNAQFETTINGATGTTSQTVFNVSPQLGYFITQGFAITLNADFNFSDASTRVSLQPGIRAYVYNDLFVMANVGFGQTTLTDSDIRLNSFNWQIGVGYSFFLAPNVALEPGLYYQYTRDTNTAVNSSKTIGRIINLGLGLKIFL
jgi:opacity protein-like surface antigen